MPHHQKRICGTIKGAQIGFTVELQLCNQKACDKAEDSKELRCQFRKACFNQNISCRMSTALMLECFLLKKKKTSTEIKDYFDEWNHL